MNLIGFWIEIIRRIEDFCRIGEYRFAWNEANEPKQIQSMYVECNFYSANSTSDIQCAAFHSVMYRFTPNKKNSDRAKETNFFCVFTKITRSTTRHCNFIDMVAMESETKLRNARLGSAWYAFYLKQQIETYKSTSKFWMWAYTFNTWDTHTTINNKILKLAQNRKVLLTQRGRNCFAWNSFISFVLDVCSMCARCAICVNAATLNSLESLARCVMCKYSTSTKTIRYMPIRNIYRKREEENHI